MKKPLWFKAKTYGWGWTPATWQGWLLVLMYVAFVMVSFFEVDNRTKSVDATLINWIAMCLLATVTLIAICYATGEKPKWRWGKK